MVSYDYQCESSAQRPPPKLGQFWEILRNFDTTRLKLLFSVYIWYHNHANVFRQQLYLVGFWYHDHHMMASVYLHYLSSCMICGTPVWGHMVEVWRAPAKRGQDEDKEHDPRHAIALGPSRHGPGGL